MNPGNGSDGSEPLRIPQPHLRMISERRSANHSFCLQVTWMNSLMRPAGKEMSDRLRCEMEETIPFTKKG